MESEKGSLLETMNIIEGVKKTLTGRIAGKFVPFAVRNIFAQNVQIETECEHLKAALLQMYSDALAYLNTWTKQYDEFKVFTWMNLS
ncbi:hypothetical protein Bhyg_03281, partial [Pseudolycoriella hygida]